jgi:tetratricopeptide (TPR) repeat protein
MAVVGVSLFLLAVAAAPGCRRSSPVASSLAAGDALMGRNPQAALVEYQRALGQGGGTRALERIAFAQAALGQWLEAEAALDKLAPDAEANPDLTFIRAQVKIARGQPAAGRDILEKVVSRPDAPVRPLLLYAALAQTPEQAGRARQRLVAWQPPPADGQRASVHKDGAEYRVALAALDRISGTPPAGGNAARSGPPGSAVVGDLGLALAMARVYQGAGQRQWAARLMEAALAAPEPPPGLDKQLAELALEMGDLDLAARALHHARTEFAADHEALALKARMLQQRGQTAEAVATWKRALEALPAGATALERARLRLGGATAELARGDQAAARKTLEQITTDTPALTDAALTLAGLDMNAGKPREAAARLEKVIAAEPQATRAYPLLVAARLAEGNVAAAERAAETYLRLGKGAPDAVVLLSQIHVRCGRRPAALALLTQALSDRPGEMLLLRALAEMVSAGEGHAKATALVEAQIERAASRARPLALLGDLEARAGRLARAEAAYRRATEADPREPLLWRRLAALREKQGNDQGSLAALEKAGALAPQDPELSQELAAAYMKSGRYPEAARVYEALLATSPTSTLALNNLSVLYADRLNQPARAVDLARKARQLAPGLSAVADTLGWALVKTGDRNDLREAVRLLQGSAVELGTAEAHYHLGIALMKSGQDKEGRAELKKALGLSPKFEAAADARAALGR